MISVKIPTCILILSALIFVQCKKDKKTDPSGSSNSKVSKIIVNGNDPQEYYFEYSGNVLSKVSGYGVGDFDITQSVVCEYEFESDGKLKSQYTTFEGEKYKSSYFYNSERKLTRVEYGVGENPDLSTYYYNVAGANVHCTYSFYESDNTYHLVDSNVYSSLNSFGKPELKTTYYYAYYNGVPVLSNVKQRYSYDVQGYLIKEEYYDKDESKWVVQYEYEYNTGKPLYYPEEFQLYYRFMDGQDIDIFSPNDLVNNRIPVKTIYHTECNSTSVSCETNRTSIEVNSQGEITREAWTDEHVEDNCTKTYGNVEILFYY